jgi:hypothetical protein
MPPAAYELSWSTGELRSEIRPKEKRIAHLRRRLETLSPDDPAFDTVRESIEEERQKIAEFEKFNAKPRSNSFRR